MPWFEGYKCRRAPHLGWRQSHNPHTCEIVKISDCRIYTDEKGVRRYDPADAPTYIECDPSNGNGTGSWRHYKRPIIVARAGNKNLYAPEYWSCAKYFVRNGLVYQGSYKVAVDPTEAEYSNREAWAQYRTALDWLRGLQFANALRLIECAEHIGDCLWLGLPINLDDLELILTGLKYRMDKDHDKQ